MINAESIRKLDFVRTKDGTYAQVTDVQDNYVVTDEGIFGYDEIDDYNKNINKLVVEGDFVNGAKVYRSKENLMVNGNYLYNVNIVQVISKRRFYANCYSPNARSTISNCKWQTIKQFPKYEVSTTGIVREVDSGKILTYVSGKEAPYVRLEDNRDKKVMSVAILVLDAFVGHEKNKVPSYKDSNKFNCNLSNLEWVADTVYMKESVVKSNIPKAYKYKYLIGYYNGIPVMYADCVRSALDFMFDNCSNVVDTKTYKLTTSIRDGRPYHGINFEMVSEEDYYNNMKLIDLSKFKDFYRENIQKKSSAIQNNSNDIIPISKYLNTPNEKSIVNMSYLDEPTDDEIFALEEELQHKTTLSEFKSKLYAVMDRYE